DAQTREGGDLITVSHGREPSRVGSAGAAGHYDSCDDARQLAHASDAYQVGHIRLRRELPQLRGADKGNDGADEQIDDADNGDCSRASVIEIPDEIGSTNVSPPREELEGATNHRDGQHRTAAEVGQKARRPTADPCERREPPASHD